MKKTDKSIHDICIASIKRSTIKPYDFKWTNFYDTNTDFPYSALSLDLAENELIICSTVIDKDNFSILTTRQLMTKKEGQLNTGDIQAATDKLYGDFKGDKDKLITFGQVQLKNGNELKYFIETGHASMVMIHGVRTLIRTAQMTNQQIENVTRLWLKQKEK
jgi:hypothetical protein